MIRITDLALILFFVFASFTTIISLIARRYLTSIVMSAFAGMMWLVMAASFYNESVTFALMFAIFGIVVMLLGAVNLMRAIR